MGPTIWQTLASKKCFPLAPFVSIKMVVFDGQKLKRRENWGHFTFHDLNRILALFRQQRHITISGCWKLICRCKLAASLLFLCFSFRLYCKAEWFILDLIVEFPRYFRLFDTLIAYFQTCQQTEKAVKVTLDMSLLFLHVPTIKSCNWQGLCFVPFWVVIWLFSSSFDYYTVVFKY